MTKKTRTSNIFEQVTEIYLILMVTVFLLYPGRQGFGGIAEEKYRAFLLLCGGYAAIMLLLLAETAIVGGLHRDIRSALKRTSWTQRLLAIYLLLTWISALLSPYFPDTVIGVGRYEGALTITIYCACFFFVRAYGKAGKVLIAAMALSVSGFCVICIIQLYGGNPFGLYPAGYNYADAYKAYSGAYLGTIGNVDLVAAFLCMMIPACWATILRSGDRQRFYLLAPLTLALFVLIKMDVLAGFVGVFGGAAVSVAVIAPMEKRLQRTLAMALLAVALAMLAVVYFADLGGMFHELHAILHGNAEGSFGSGRLHIWKSVLQRVPEHLLFGTGPDTMLYSDIEAFSRYDEVLGGTIVARIDIAHNEYLNILYHQGILALASYLGALIAAAKKWVCGSGQDAVTAVLGTMLFCYSVQAFFGFSMIMTAPYFYLALALLDKRDTKEGEQ